MEIEKIKNEAKRAQQLFNNLDSIGVYLNYKDIKKNKKTCQIELQFSLKRFLKLFYNEKIYLINSDKNSKFHINFFKNEKKIYDGITKCNYDYLLYFDITKKIKAFTFINSLYDYEYLKFYKKRG